MSNCYSTNLKTKTLLDIVLKFVSWKIWNTMNAKVPDLEKRSVQMKTKSILCSDNIWKSLNAYVSTYMSVYCLCIDTHTYRRYYSTSNFLPFSYIKLIANYFFLFFSQLNFYSSCGVFISAMQCGQSHQHFMSHVIWLLQFTMSSLSLLYSIQLGKWSVDLVINYLSFRFHAVQLKMGEWDRMQNGKSHKYLILKIKWLLDLKLFSKDSRICPINLLIV